MVLAVLASGSGTIFEAICDASIRVDRLVTDRACRALEIAESRGIKAIRVDRGAIGPGFDRPAYTQRVIDALDGVDTVAMAGFMTVLSAPMFVRFHHRVLNTHPSLLPSFPGAHAVPDALAYGVKVTGCTVHIATEQVDHGPILAQEAVPVLPTDDEDALHERIKAVERRLYPATIEEFLR
ncbi:MAG: phosphoribosylglycinamide formyltransferase [Acidimicrobiia bacterium]